jgi:uncharacterized protein (TIRG00374 family)
MRLLSVAFAIALAAVLLFLSIHGIDWYEAARTIGGASIPGLVVAAAIAMSTLFLRAVRWRILLNAEGKVPVATTFLATSAGYFGNNFLPARAGELVRTMIVSSRAGLRTGFVLTTALAERAADAIVLVLVSAGILLVLPNPPGWLSHAARPFALAGIAGALAIAIMQFLESRGRAISQRMPLPDALRARMASSMMQIANGLRSFHNVRRLTGFLGLTVVIWCLDAAGAVITGAALGVAVPPIAAILLITGLSLGSALPSTPGYVGVYQFVAVTVLTPFGVTRTDAIAFIVVAQALMYAVIGCFGAIGLLRFRATAAASRPPLP